MFRGNIHFSLDVTIPDREMSFNSASADYSRSGVGLQTAYSVLQPHPLIYGAVP